VRNGFPFGNIIAQNTLIDSLLDYVLTRVAVIDVPDFKKQMDFDWG